MEHDCRVGSVEQRHPLCSKCSQDAREHIAGASLCHAGIAGVADCHEPFVRHDGAGALENDDRAGLFRQTAGCTRTVSLYLVRRDAEEPCGFGRVRREDGSSLRYPFYVAGGDV